MKRHGLAALLVLAGCVHRPPALPWPLQVDVMRIPWENAFPSDVAVDDSGRVWFTDRLTHVIGRYDPSARAFARFSTPTERSAPYGMIRTPDGALWFAESTLGRLGRVDVKTGGIEEVALPGLTSGGPHLLVHSGKRIWFTAREARQWGWYDPATGEVAIHPFTVRAPAGSNAAQLRYVNPYSIAAARGGGVWIGTYDQAYLLRARRGVDTLEQHVLARELPPDTAMMRRYLDLPDSLRRRMASPVRRDAVGARRSTSDSRGTVWLSDFVHGRVVRFSESAPDTFVSYPSQERTAGPYGIAMDPWGRVWYDEMKSGNLVMLDPRSGRRTLIPVSQPGAAIRHIAFDKERKRVWLPLSDAGMLGMLQLR